MEIEKTGKKEQSSFNSLAEKLIIARQEKAAKKKELQRLEIAERAAQDELIQLMAEKEVSSFTHKKFGKFSSAQRIWVSIADFEPAFDYFEKLGIDQEIFRKTAISARLNQFVNEKLKNGEVVPEFLKISLSKYISVRK